MNGRPRAVSSSCRPQKRRGDTKATIVLPTYNEAENIVDLVRAILKHTPDGWEYEVLVLDDNSPDGTLNQVLTHCRDERRVSPIARTGERGLAKSLRDGAERAQGDWVVFMDSDFTHDPADLPTMLHLATVFDVVIGSRFCAGGTMEDTWHYIMSLAYNWFIRVVLRTQVQDNIGGYVAIRRDALRQLPWDAVFFGYGDYCFRLLHHAQRRGMSIIETPVHFRTRQKGSSKSHFAWLLLSYTGALFSVKWASFRGDTRD